MYPVLFELFTAIYCVNVSTKRSMSVTVASMSGASWKVAGVHKVGNTGVLTFRNDDSMLHNQILLYFMPCTAWAVRAIDGGF